MIIAWLLVISMILPLNYPVRISQAKVKNGGERRILTKEEKEKEEWCQQFTKKENKLKKSSSGKTMIKNDYLEFMVGDSGRFTIGNVEGNKNYTSDNNKILLYDHPSPRTSFSTVRIESNTNERKDLKFSADNNIYDTENKKVTSVMNAKGSFESGEEYDFIITQYLTFVTGNDGVDDTVKISYTIKNNGAVTQKAGVRIMMDTMLASNDDAPFKVLGYGNVLSELELKKEEIPSTYQVYDSLEKPTTFATGTLYLENDRVPDKVQFARWNIISDTLYDYNIGKRAFGDSAVAVYFDPIDVEPTKSTDVCTYYGVNSNLTSGENTEIFNNIDVSQYGVFVYDGFSKDGISDAVVTIDGDSVTTNESGLAIFDNYKDKNGKNVNVKVEKDGYSTIEVPRSILCGSFAGIGIVSQNGSLTEVSALSVVIQSGNNTHDLLTTYAYYDQADAEDEERKDGSIIIRVVGVGDTNKYRLVQAGKVKYESDDGTFEIPIVTKDKQGNNYMKPRIVGLSAGQDVTLEMISYTLGEKKIKLGLKISTPVLSTPEDEKTSISIGDNIVFKISDNVPLFGGMEMNVGTINPLKLTITSEEGGKVRVAVGDDLNDPHDKDSWDKFEESYNEAKETIRKTNKLKEFVHGMQGGSYGVGPLKYNCDFMGYGEGVPDANGNLNIELGIILQLKETKDLFTHYFFLFDVPVFVNVGEKGEIYTQIKGNLVYGDGNFSFVGGDCIIRPSFELSFELGVGIKGALSASGIGRGELNWEHRFSNNYNRVWLTAALEAKLQCFAFELTKPLFESSEITLYDSNNQSDNLRQYGLLKNKSKDFSFELVKREENDIDTYALNDNLELESMYLDVREVITEDGKRYRFYLADDNNREDENRTTIVFQKYSDGNWSAPIQLENDGTADYNFDLLVKGNDIYIVWQNMNRTFDENVTLADMVEACQLRLCKLDTSSDTVTKIYDSSNDHKGDFLPSIAGTSDNKIKIAWYSNSSNYIYGNTTQAEDEHDIIYYAEIPTDGHDVVKNNHIDIAKGRVMTLAVQNFNGKDIIVYSLDEDGDFNTQDDVALYKLSNTEIDKLPITGKLNTSAKFSLLDGKKTMFCYSDGNVAYTSTGNEGDIAYVFNKKDIPSGLSDRFVVLSNEDGTECCILWRKQKDDNNIDIYAVNYKNNVWSNPYVLKTVSGKDVSIPTGYLKNGNVELSYGYQDTESKPSVCSETIENSTDISLDDIIFKQRDVIPNSDMKFDIELSNKGLKDVSSVCVEVSDYSKVLKSQNVNVDLGVGETKTVTIPSAFTVPENLDEVTTYQVTIYANDENAREDNEQEISIGYTDVSIKENGRFMNNGNEYIALKASNLSKFDAKNVRVKLLADSMDGVVVYDNYIENLEADAEKIYNINVNQLADSRVAYAIISSESEEFQTYNNTELLAINPYIKKEIVLYNFDITAQEGGKIIAGLSGKYASGTEITIKAQADSGYEFVGWVSEKGRFTDASKSETTFAMPEEDVTVIAKFKRKEMPKYNFTITAQKGGKIVTGTSGEYISGTEITIKAQADSGYEFVGWMSEKGKFIDASKLETIFVMPEEDVTVTAKFKKKIQQIWGSIVTDPTSIPTYTSTATPTPTVTITPKPTTAPPLATPTPVVVTPTPESTPTITETVAPSIKPSEVPEEKVPANSKKKLKKGDVVKDKKSKAKYKILNTSSKKASVEYTAPTNKKLKKVVIPETVTIKNKKYRVTKIGEKAFAKNKNITIVKIGNNINAIGKKAFEGCSKLNYIVIGKNVSKISEKAFNKCKNLHYIQINTKKLTLKNTGKDAFANGYGSPRVKSDKSVWEKYSRIFSQRGISAKALYIIDPVKLII